jgi:hypothetical protein
VLQWAYEASFGRLDRLVRAISRRRFERAVSADDPPEAVRIAWLDYIDRVAVTVLANFGLTTQLAVLGICLAIGRPALYLWLVLGCLAALVPLQLRAEARARSALSTRRAA